AVDVSDRFADGRASRAELAAAGQASGDADTELLYSRDDGWDQPEFFAACVATWSAHAPQERDYPSMVAQLATAVVAAQRVADYARDVFGNPFRPVSFGPRWRTPAAAGVASAVYDERAFDRLPVLADALEDAGCSDAEVLAHLRSVGPHVRGCWALDLALGKE